MRLANPLRGRNVEIFSNFISGFILGFYLISQVSFLNELPLESSSDDVTLDQQNENKQFDSSLAESFQENIKILCMIMTTASQHRNKSDHIKRFWGSKCNKLLFITTKADENFETIVINVNDTKKELRKKIREGYMHVYTKYLNDYDWFLKADDDAFVVMENLRYMLHQYRTRTSLFFGHRIAVVRPEAKQNYEEGYMAGFTYIMSRKALTKFAKFILVAPSTDPIFHTNYGEDLEMGRILGHNAIFVDERDELKQKRFFPMNIYEHLKETTDPKYWYRESLYYQVNQGLSCCSDVPIGFHYINGSTVYYMEYFVYKVHAFGMQKNLTESPPRKLTLDEIIEASDRKSEAKLYFNHTDFHRISEEEKF